MNTLETTRHSIRQSPQPEIHPETQFGLPNRTARRVGIIDRVALHIGLALITWGRRSAWSETHERRANRVEQQLALRERELAAERMRYLGSPRP